MIIGFVIQQPAETVDYDIDFAGAFDENDPLLVVTAVATPSGELTVSAVITTPTTAKVWISGGLDGHNYKVEITGFTAEGRVKQDELEVLIEDF